MAAIRNSEVISSDYFLTEIFCAKKLFPNIDYV
jgi:hypothetical protein